MVNNNWLFKKLICLVFFHPFLWSSISIYCKTLLAHPDYEHVFDTFHFYIRKDEENVEKVTHLSDDLYGEISQNDKGRKCTYCHMNGKFAMVQIVAFVSIEMNKNRKEDFLALFCDTTAYERPQYCYVRSRYYYNTCIGTSCQRLSVCHRVKFFLRKFFARKKAVNSPSAVLAVDVKACPEFDVTICLEKNICF